MNVDYPAWTMQLACSVGSGVGAPLVIHGSQATLFVAQNSESLTNTQMEIVPDQEYRDEFAKKTGAETLKIDVQPVPRGGHPHMDNFLECVRSRQEPNLPGAARLSGDGGDRHGRAGLPPERGAVLRSPAREGHESAGRDVGSAQRRRLRVRIRQCAALQLQPLIVSAPRDRLHSGGGSCCRGQPHPSAAPKSTGHGRGACAAGGAAPSAATHRLRSGSVIGGDRFRL